MPKNRKNADTPAKAKEEQGEATMAGFVDWLLSLPRDMHFEREGVEFDPLEKWQQYDSK